MLKYVISVKFPVFFFFLTDDLQSTAKMYMHDILMKDMWELVDVAPPAQQVMCSVKSLNLCHTLTRFTLPPGLNCRERCPFRLDLLTYQRSQIEVSVPRRDGTVMFVPTR